MIRVANAPCSWGVLEFESAVPNAPMAQVLDEMRASGYVGTELGDSRELLLRARERQRGDEWKGGAHGDMLFRWDSTPCRCEWGSARVALLRIMSICDADAPACLVRARRPLS